MTICAACCPVTATGRDWLIRRGQLITGFDQYAHLKEVDALVRASPQLRISLGMDYLIKPDVTVGLAGVRTGSGLPPLHAAISCKWTIRSDRVQNIRHECLQMIRHRRGRQPHLVTVTAEPLPSRLASIARGTGEVDAVYHIGYDAMAASVAEHANAEQADAWREVTSSAGCSATRSLPRPSRHSEDIAVFRRRRVPPPAVRGCGQNQPEDGRGRDRGARWLSWRASGAC